jgi:hypothetical protein
MQYSATKLLDIAARFDVDGNVREVRPFGNGLINDSYFVETNANAPDYVMQRINHNIFTDVDMLQNNIEAVTAHIRSKLSARGEKDIERKVLRFVSERDGKKYYYDGEDYWRMMYFIPRSVSYEKVDAKSSGYAGSAFGDFQSMLADLPYELGEVIPKFHNIEFRLEQLRDAVTANSANRLTSARTLIEEVGVRITDMCKSEILFREGTLPKRVCHCDTKVNNILFDESGNILCVVDLDTVMPSFIFSDYGDFLRTSANTAPEDEQNLDNIKFNMDIFRAFTKSYLVAARSFLTDIEIANLPYAAALFPYMQFVRFLADYINGDKYYKILYPEHNLVRAKAQLRLLQCVEKNTADMEAYIQSLL